MSRWGGWSQQRYERRRDNELHKYALEIVEALAKICSSEEINHILMVGSKETLQAIHENMTDELRDKVVEKAIDLSKGDASINKDIVDLFQEEELTTGLEHWEKNPYRIPAGRFGCYRSGRCFEYGKDSTNRARRR